MRKAALILMAGGLIAGAASALTVSQSSAPRSPDQVRAGSGEPVARLNAALKSGVETLAYDKDFNYLPAVLKALGILPESQLLVFSKTSLQLTFISPSNPRSIFFNDDTAVAWIRGGAVLEVATYDPQQGIVFYTLDQSRQTQPILGRESEVCQGCHAQSSSEQISGLIVRTVFPGETGALMSGLTGVEVDHRTLFAERWGGWYVTGKHGPLYHRANAVVTAVRESGVQAAPADASREPLPEKFSTKGYLTPYSDVVALTTFEHQVHMMNELVRIGRDARFQPNSGVEKDARELVDYMFFVDEAPLTAPLEGTSGFAEKFAGLGPFDSKGRSLRQFDLQKRLMRYPCSYMIYSEAFQLLPPDAKRAIYARMWAVLSGSVQDERYGRLSRADRATIVGILRETVDDLPEFFRR